MTKPDPAQRPRVVVWAYRCWLLAGALLVILGVVYAVLAVIVPGPTLLPVGIGVLIAAIGAAEAFIGTKAYTGDERWRSSLAALTLVAVIMLLILSFLESLLAFALLAAVIGLFGSLLAYRPEGDAWFTGKNPADIKKGQAQKAQTSTSAGKKRGRSGR
ncbi:hypothetical protein [Gordonia sp. i37]|uniref:hypothetical protein n=1 Tax=Gordonia sp. i37 TaxID=1961707 RepID=UPI0009CBDADB|nr:hypothetical protein [Gordonia sp. i37]OPX16696.1 hypothetical protein B1964_03535 [Gordonia sp. i37]